VERGGGCNESLAANMIKGAFNTDPAQWWRDGSVGIA
jgi:hypothetical protein